MNDSICIYLADLAHTYSVDDRSLPIPLGIGYIKAYAMANLGKSISIKLFKHPEKFMTAVNSNPPDIIGFANYGWNEQLNKEVGKHIRKLAPNTMIVAGGPNVDVDRNNRAIFLSEHDYIDYLIIDGGEQPFTELIKWWKNNQGRPLDKESLPNNLVYLNNGNLYETEERPLKKIIDDIPSPYLAGYLDDFLKSGMIPLFETNRGCPFKCTFCAWGSASKDLVRRMSLDQALAEIQYVGQRSDARNWIICDANFGILKRDIDLAKAIRKVRDETGTPEKCHIWLAKNATERNLEIGEIFGDMTVPVMAVQSLEDEVLKNIKRDNISLDTYADYQQKFHSIGSRTYSDLIVPLPGETLGSHLAALKELMSLGVDIIQNHNMRLLAGAETNDPQTRNKFNFHTRCRLIHGDAGIYQDGNGTELSVFEYEESLRETSTMKEDELFYLRKIHFLVDFCWNIEVYKPLLKTALAYGVNPIDIIVKVFERSSKPEFKDSSEFWLELEKYSQQEWFENEEDIKAYFEVGNNFNRLIGQEFEKLNIKFSIILLRDVKTVFDEHFLYVIEQLNIIPQDVLNAVGDYTFAQFPPLSRDNSKLSVDLPDNYFDITYDSPKNAFMNSSTKKFWFVESDKRAELRAILSDAQQKTLSKVLNTQGISLRDLRLELA